MKKLKKKNLRKPKVILTKEQKAEIKRINAEKKKQNAYSEKIKSIFVSAGFLSIPVKGKEFKIGNRSRNELDHCFVYENIIILCEDTLATTGVRDHIRTKKETAIEINNNIEEFLEFLNTRGFDKTRYTKNRWKIFHFYFSYNKIELTDEDKELFKPYYFINPSIFEYFSKMSASIKRSFRFEIFRFLDINKKEIGKLQAGANNTGIEVAIIHPDDVTGINEGVHLVSFMISAGDLLKYSYVLRKDNWEDSYALYQRLLTSKRIRNIREFVIKKQRTFFNNIIVSLPEEVVFKDAANNEVDIDALDSYDNYKMSIPDKFNSIGIIDGQHRVFAYYEDEPNNPEEIAISALREKLHLLVTGLIFPIDWAPSKKREFESDIFLQINSNAKIVEKDIILHIEATKNRYSETSIARQILVNMNKIGPFKDLFQLSLVENAPIKTASIIQFALSKLVRPDISSDGLYKYWNLDGQIKPEKLIDDDKLLTSYINFCTTALNEYFGAIKDVYKNVWDTKTKLLKIVSINAFIIALNNTLNVTNGVKDFNFYKTLFSKDKIDFTAKDFAYSGSKYAQFARDKIEPLFAAK